MLDRLSVALAVAVGLAACAEDDGPGEFDVGDSPVNTGDTDVTTDDDVDTDTDMTTDEEPPADMDDPPIMTGSLDPAPDVTTAGETTTGSCPSVTTSDPFELDASSATFYRFTGTLEPAIDTPGTFYVYGGAGEEITGPIETSFGYYTLSAPLFCGSQVVKLVWEGSGCRTVLVYLVDAAPCEKLDLRVTILWDDLGRDWELHLIKPGGRINDNATDCTWTSCINSSPDWGVMGDTEDDPKKDIDDLTSYGPESIYLRKLEDGTYTIMVEHWSSSGSPDSDGVAIINLGGTTTIVEIENLKPYYVWTVATIGGGDAVTVVDTLHDCTANWSGGCRDMIP